MKQASNFSKSGDECGGGNRTDRFLWLQAAIAEGLASPPSARTLDEIIAEGFRRWTLLDRRER